MLSTQDQLDGSHGYYIFPWLFDRRRRLGNNNILTLPRLAIPISHKILQNYNTQSVRDYLLRNTAFRAHILTFSIPQSYESILTITSRNEVRCSLNENAIRYSPSFELGPSRPYQTKCEYSFHDMTVCLENLGVSTAPLSLFEGIIIRNRCSILYYTYVLASTLYEVPNL